jgi:D-alanyl-lipoteichoic acid acyltransferase DltB (MBOAT superfamily)
VCSSDLSDMAIGLALLLGFRFNLNFDSPYKSTSIREFWQRWHISLSSWLRDYLYISLGGNRKGRTRTYINLFITMLLGGLWHGANWNFIIWGGMHGIALAVHKFFYPKKKTSTSVSRCRHCLSVLFTFHFVMFTWVFFRCNSLDDCLTMMHQLLTGFHPQLFPQLLLGYRFVFILLLVGYVLHFAPVRAEYFFRNSFAKLPLFLKAVSIVILIYFIVQIKSSDIQPFIYFRF